jgi:hypothetical protein
MASSFFAMAMLWNDQGSRWFTDGEPVRHWLSAQLLR